MHIRPKLGGAVPPLITPITARGDFDKAALDRLIATQTAARVEGIFVLGTTGEGPSVPRKIRRKIVERAVAAAKRRTLVYAGVSDNALADAIASANDYFDAGADVVVALSPAYYPPQSVELLAWFRAFLNAVRGPVVIYNIPATTHVSLPLGVVAELIDHPRLVGIKDSENNAPRQEELLWRFGGRRDFSIFVGTGALMAQGLKRGAHGIVPSTGNLVPEICQQQCEAARRADWAGVDRLGQRMNEVSALYHQGRTLGQSLAVLKALLHLRGICAPHMLPPLLELPAAELAPLRAAAAALNLL